MGCTVSVGVPSGVTEHSQPLIVNTLKSDESTHQAVPLQQCGEQHTHGDACMFIHSGQGYNSVV